MDHQLIIGSKHLGIDDVAKIADPTSGPYPAVGLSDEARTSLDEVRAFMEREWLAPNSPTIYSLNTGTGAFKDRRLSPDDISIAQVKGILAFCASIGEPFSERETRAMMLLRAKAMASSSSGARPALIDRLLSFLNLGLHPIVPQKGSVGTSGDLAPLAHMSAAVIGVPEAEIVFAGKRLPAREAIQRAGLNPDIDLHAKDTSSLINGATTSAAVLALNIHDARNVTKVADIALALSMEAMRAETNAFDPRLHDVRRHTDQAKVARNTLKIIAGSERCTEAARQTVFPGESREIGSKIPDRIQDVYSLRCAPQVHGPARQAIEYAAQTIEIEINSSIGNPLIFPNGTDKYVALASGHFHGQYVAQAADVLSIGLADLGSISERRVVRLIDPGMSYGLPRNLASGRPGLDTGFPAVQTAMSALVMENRHLAAPGSVDSIPGKGNFEDHVSNATWCARKSTIIVRNLEYLIAIEAMMAAQALSLVADVAVDHPIGRGSRAALACIRSEIDPCLEGDRFLSPDIEKAVGLLRSGKLLSAVEREVGPLE